MFSHIFTAVSIGETKRAVVCVQLNMVPGSGTCHSEFFVVVKRFLRFYYSINHALCFLLSALTSVYGILEAL